VIYPRGTFIPEGNLRKAIVVLCSNFTRARDFSESDGACPGTMRNGGGSVQGKEQHRGGRPTGAQKEFSKGEDHFFASPHKR
jgi:hypothetical protein